MRPRDGAGGQGLDDAQQLVEAGRGERRGGDAVHGWQLGIVVLLHVRQGHQRDAVNPCIQAADLTAENDIGVNVVDFPRGRSRSSTNSVTIDMMV